MKIIILLISFSLTACDRTVKFDPDMSYLPDEQATVIFYLEHGKGLFEPSVSIPVIANDVEIGQLDNGMFITHYFKPGSYKLHSHTAAIDRISNFVFEKGEVYFIKVWADIGVWVSSIRFTQTSKPDKI